MVELKAVGKGIEWGKLVKSWATGVNYFDPDQVAIPIPSTLAEFKAQCTARGIPVNLPDYITELSIQQMAKHRLNVHLPSKELVLEAEAQLTAPGATYPIPSFYDDIYDSQLGTLSKEKTLELQAARIGDYAIGMCA